MAVSVLRNQIANMTIDEILRNRAKLRDAIKSEMQELLSGWGVWLETCEILDVKIVSTSLFQNL
jgi:regulator of protease activity HflC (stomatin/prohibitin superfamily)